KLRRLFRQQADLVDRQRLDAVVLPVVRVPVQLGLRQERGGQRAGRGRLAKSGLAHEQVGVREAAALQLRAQLAESLVVPDYSFEGIAHPVQPTALRVGRL